MTADLELYSAAVCPFAQKTRILLNEKNLDYKYIEIDLDNKPESFLKISPNGKVPLIKHKDQYIYESDIINEYVNEVFPASSMLSEDPFIRAQMRIWIAYCNGELVPAYYKLLLSQDAAQYPVLRENLTKILLHIEKEGFEQWSHMGPYFFGGIISLVDICFYPFFERFVTNEYYRNAAIPEKCYQLRTWIRHMRAHPSVRLTSNPPEFYINRYVKYANGTTDRPGAKKIIDDLWT